MGHQRKGVKGYTMGHQRKVVRGYTMGHQRKVVRGYTVDHQRKVVRGYTMGHQRKVVRGYTVGHQRKVIRGYTTRGRRGRRRRIKQKMNNRLINHWSHVKGQRTKLIRHYDSQQINKPMLGEIGIRNLLCVSLTVCQLQTGFSHVIISTSPFNSRLVFDEGKRGGTILPFRPTHYSYYLYDQHGRGRQTVVREL